MKKAKETANGITANIIRVVNMQPGCSAIRINSTGIYDTKRGIFRTSNGTAGVEDIICIIRGKYVGIEVKAGKDAQRSAQKARQIDVEKSGGVYFIARSTDSFLEFFTEINNK